MAGVPRNARNPTAAIIPTTPTSVGAPNVSRRIAPAAAAMTASTRNAVRK